VRAMIDLHRSLLVLLVAAACHPTGGGHETDTDDDTSGEPTGTVFPSGMPTGPATTAVIGPEGGTLDSADGMLRLTIGPGALAEDTTIGIEPITNTAPGGLGTAYRLSPDGTTFANPVELAFVVEDGDLAGSVEDVLTIGFQDHEGLWWAAPESDVVRELDANTIAVSTTHFSDWSRLSGLQLRPPEQTVREGETIGLTVVDCQTQGGDEENLPSLLAQCSIDAELPPLPGLVDEWAVDGIRGGSETVGTVIAGSRPDQALYTAPEFVVGIERHTVSAKMRRRSGEVVLLVSNITVTGSFTFELSGFYSAEGSSEACQLVSSSVSDRVDVVIAVNEAGIYDVEDITNHTTTYSLGSLPPMDPGSLKLDVPPEHLDASDGSVTTVVGSDELGVSLFGTNTTGGCTYTVQDVPIGIPSMSMESGVAMSFAISDLIDGSLLIAEEANWSWTVTQIE
jgi:hypothetical protein